MFLVFEFIVLIYVFQLTIYIWGWKKSLDKKKEFHSKIETYSVIIPFRNPSKNLNAILEDLTNTTFRSIDIILIDDFSESEYILGLKNANLLYLHEEYPNLSSKTNNKKQAITFGVKIAKGNYIICLDADVILPKNWLTHTIHAIESFQPKFLAGVHQYQPGNSFLSNFLEIEHEVLTTISASSMYWGIPTMCNGANMAFEKAAFYEVKGYEGVLDVLGGDDLLLMHRIFREFPHRVFYNLADECSVSSIAPKNLYELKKQRKRWLNKTFSYENKFVLPQMALIFIANFVSICSLILTIFHPIFIFVFFTKCVSDILFKISTDNFKKRTIKIYDLVLSSVLYPFYCIWIVSVSLYGNKSNHN